MTTSTLHQLAIGLRLPEKTLHSWNKNFKIIPTKNETGQLIYSAEQIEQVLHIHHLIKERGFTISGALKELKKEVIIDQKKAKTIKKLEQIRQFLLELKEAL